jgi:predicted TIM-barrel fold metal-dependent hydrolase
VVRVLTRRSLLITSAALFVKPKRKDLLVETHLHLFSADQKRFPFHANAAYRPTKFLAVEEYVQFARMAGIDRAIIVHPEPYQDDHSYLKYCFQHEGTKGFFRGTCLYDPVDPATPARIGQLMKELPGRLVALRIHATAEPKDYPTTAGPIRDRDLASAGMRRTWKAVHEQGLAIQMQLTPRYAAQVRKLAAEFRDGTVILDHLGRPGQGDASDYEDVLRMSALPHVVMKFSGVEYLSKQGYPYLDAKPLVKRVVEAYGPDRIVWGGLGSTFSEFHGNREMFDGMLDFLPETDRAKIRGANAMRIFKFT